MCNYFPSPVHTVVICKCSITCHWQLRSSFGDFNNGDWHVVKISIAESNPEMGLITRQTFRFSPYVSWRANNDSVSASNDNVSANNDNVSANNDNVSVASDGGGGKQLFKSVKVHSVLFTSALFVCNRWLWPGRDAWWSPDPRVHRWWQPLQRKHGLLWQTRVGGWKSVQAISSCLHLANLMIKHCDLVCVWCSFSCLIFNPFTLFS